VLGDPNVALTAGVWSSATASITGGTGWDENVSLMAICPKYGLTAQSDTFDLYEDLSAGCSACNKGYVLVDFNISGCDAEPCLTAQNQGGVMRLTYVRTVASQCYYEKQIGSWYYLLRVQTTRQEIQGQVRQNQGGEAGSDYFYFPENSPIDICGDLATLTIHPTVGNCENDFLDDDCGGTSTMEVLSWV
jgi:hypothetical protein